MMSAMKGAGLVLALVIGAGLTFSTAHAESNSASQINTDAEVTTALQGRSYSGTLVELDAAGDFLVLQSGQDKYRVNIEDDTHLFVSPNTPGVIGDFEVGNRVVVHLNRGHHYSAGSISLIGSGSVLGESDEDDTDTDEDTDDRNDHDRDSRMRTFTAEVTSMAMTGSDTGSLTVTMGANAHLDGTYGDKFGEEGDSMTLYFNNNTDFTRRYGGPIDSSDIHMGDHLVVTGYISQNGNIIVTNVHDMSLWVYGVMWHTAEIVSINTDTNTLVVKNDDFRGLDDTVTVHYGTDSAFMVDGAVGDEMDLHVGDALHIRGEAHDDDGMITINNVTNLWVSTM